MPIEDEAKAALGLDRGDFQEPGDRPLRAQQEAPTAAAGLGLGGVFAATLCLGNCAVQAA